MLKIFSSFIVVFVISSLVFSIGNTEVKASNLSKNDKKFITDFRWLDFLKICSDKKCDIKNIQWLKLWSEDSWLEATRSDDSQDYLDSCILYEIWKKEIKKTKSSILSKAIQKEWKVKKDVSILELTKIHSKLDNPVLYLSDFDYIAKYPRYLKKIAKNKIINYAEVDLLKKKWTSDLYLLNCSIYMLPDMMTNVQRK